MTVQLWIDGENAECLFGADLRASVGRRAAWDSPETGTLTVNAYSTDVTAGGRLRLGAVLDLWHVSGTGQPLWRIWGPGEITDLTAGMYDENLWEIRVIAAGLLGYASRSYIGDTPWPAEPDSDRVRRVLTLLGMNPEGVPAGVGPQLIARDVDRQPGLDVLKDAADAGGGLLYENPTRGRVEYVPAAYRIRPRGVVEWDLTPDPWDTLDQTWDSIEGITRAVWADPTVRWEDDYTWDGETIDWLNVTWVLDPCAILADPFRWDTAVGARTTYCRITYGTGTTRPVVTAGSATGQVWEQSLTLDLADSSDAQARADRIVATGSEPGWSAGSVTLNVGLLTDSQRSVMRQLLRGGQFIRLATPPGSPHGPFEAFLEGWQHTYREDRDGWVWEIALFLSEWTQTVQATRWNDAQPTWDTAQGEWNGYLEGATV